MQMAAVLKEFKVEVCYSEVKKVGRAKSNGNDAFSYHLPALPSGVHKAIPLISVSQSTGF
jgi:hypothetical protein